MIQVVAASEGHCVWYGQCPLKDGTMLNCYYTGTAKQLNASAADTLSELCPMLNLTHGESTLCSSTVGK